ncbi:MAG: hypothetical protein AAFR47_21660, partial [Pseudomonadota bacterium]
PERRNQLLWHAALDIHWFIDADRPVWHFATVCDPSGRVVLMIHAYPDTWWANAEVMPPSSTGYYVIAIHIFDCNHMDRRLEIGAGYSGVSSSLNALLDRFSEVDFHLIRNDRGAVFAEDHIVIDGVCEHLLMYLQWQDSLDKSHSLPQSPRTTSAIAELPPDAPVATGATTYFVHAEHPRLLADLSRELFENGKVDKPDTVSRSLRPSNSASGNSGPIQGRGEPNGSLA